MHDRLVVFASGRWTIEERDATQTENIKDQ